MALRVDGILRLCLSSPGIPGVLALPVILRPCLPNLMYHGPVSVAPVSCGLVSVVILVALS
jgi:hypothetical protein